MAFEDAPTALRVATYVVAAAFIALRLISPRRGRLPGAKLFAAQFVLTLIGLTLALVWGALWLAQFVPKVAEFVARSAAAQHTGFTLAAATLGLMLFALRKYARLYYGLLEVLVALVGFAAYPVAPAASGPLSAATAAWGLGLMSLIYILVRGLDNIDQARQARRTAEAALPQGDGSR